MSLLLLFNQQTIAEPKVAITAIRVKRFKSIECVEIGFGKFTLLVGANNAGKSSILQAVQFSSSLLQATAASSLTWKANQFTGSLTREQVLYSPVKDVFALGSGGRLLSHAASAIILELDAQVNGISLSVSLQLTRGKNDALNIKAVGEELGKLLASTARPFSVYVPGLSGISSIEAFQSESLVRRAAIQGDANRVFRNILLLLRRDEDAWLRFTQDFTLIYPEVHIEVSFRPDIDTEISVTEEDGNGSRPIDLSGTGVLQAAQVLAYVHMYQPKVLLLDEPDAHLHPNNQRKLARLLSQLAERDDIQVALATHSRHIVDELQNFTKILWLSRGSLQPDESILIIDKLLELGALDKIDKLRNGILKFAILTEDSNLSPMRALLKSSGFEDSDFDLWSYNGCSNLDSAVTITAFIHQHDPNTVVIVHRDCDYLEAEEITEINEKFLTASIFLYVTPGTDIESVFLDPLHITEIYTSISVDRATELIRIATDGVEQKSKELFNNALVKRAQNLRNRGKTKSVDYGHISTQASAKYDADKPRFRAGKLVLNQLRILLQEELKENIDLFKVSSALSNESLRGLITQSVTL